MREKDWPNARFEPWAFDKGMAAKEARSMRQATEGEPMGRGQATMKARETAPPNVKRASGGALRWIQAMLLAVLLGCSYLMWTPALEPMVIGAWAFIGIGWIFAQKPK